MARPVDLSARPVDLRFKRGRFPRAGGEARGEGVLQLFRHLAYEYRRGVRALFLMTMTRADMDMVLPRLKEQGVASFVQEVTADKVNLFFGRPAFVAAARAFVTRPLNELTAEEDFMLGTLLGYDPEQQCARFLARVRRERPALAAE